jgi:hypothetical protein
MLMTATVPEHRRHAAPSGHGRRRALAAQEADDLVVSTVSRRDDHLAGIGSAGWPADVDDVRAARADVLRLISGLHPIDPSSEMQAGIPAEQFRNLLARADPGADPAVADHTG